MEEMPIVSRDFLENACIEAIRKAWPSNDVTKVEIERLQPPGTGPNWKLGKMFPNPFPVAEEEIRTQVAPLTQKWALEDE